MKKYLVFAGVAAAVLFFFPIQPTFAASSWTEHLIPGGQAWGALASSADGTKLIAASYHSTTTAYTGYLYRSSDSGATWLPVTTAGLRYWMAVASSGDGTKLVAAEGGGYVYTSNDSGATWVAHPSTGVQAWISVASSSDGSKLVAAAKYGYIYTSTDGGATWTVQYTSGGTHAWSSVASSASGANLAAADSGGYIYTSVDAGLTWMIRSSAGSRLWRSVASSADGSKLVAAAEVGSSASGLNFLYTSSDYGDFFAPRAVGVPAPESWTTLASSADGTVLIAAAPPYIASVTGVSTNGFVLVSTDSGLHWSVETLSSLPSANLWFGVASSADGTKLAVGDSGRGIWTGTPTGTTSGTPPTVLTVSSTVTPATVTLTGSLTDLGSSSFLGIGFQYGLTTSYGSIATAGTAAAPVIGYTASLTIVAPLSCGTLYHYRAYASNASTVAYGADKTFTTTCTPVLTVTTLPASPITATQVTMNALTVSNTLFTGADGFEYGTTTSYGLTWPTAASGVGYHPETSGFGRIVYSLPCDTLYHYRAYVAGGPMGTVYGDDVTFTTLPCAGSPVVVTDAATTVTATSAQLNGHLTANGGILPTYGSFEWGTTTAYGSVTPATSLAGPTSIFSVSLPPPTFACGTTYHFRAKATNSAGIAYGADKTFTTSPCPVSLPTVITVSASSVTTATATLNGNLTSVGGVSATVGFKYGLASASTLLGSITFGTVTATGAFTAPLGGLSCGTAYKFQAWATNTAGTATGATLTFTTPPCTGWVHDTLTANWLSSALSANGSRLIAGAGTGYLTTSDAYGAALTQRTAPGSKFWLGVATSADGMKLAAVDATPGYVYTSTDAGVTWTPRTTSGSRQWTSIASSGDGTRLIAVGGGNSVYVSTDSGATWTSRTPIPGSTMVWSSVDSSLDGMRLAMTQLSGVGYEGSIYTSVNGGTTWTLRSSAGSRNWQSIASSAGGTKLAAVARGMAGTTNKYYVYTSTDAGATWTAQAGSGLRYWSDIASSYDGTRLIAIGATDVAGTNGTLYLSSDSGVTWTPVATPGLNRWYSVSLSCDATHIAATMYSLTPTSFLGGYIWMGHNIFGASSCGTSI